MHTTPPLSTEPLKFALPTIHHDQLDNGTPLHCILDPTEDLVTVTVALSTGSIHDGIPGETSVTAQMLNRGTLRLDAAQFAEEVERRGCNLRTVGDTDACSLQASGLREWFDDLVDLASEALTQPRFDAVELDTLRRRMIADMMVDLVDVEWLAARACATRAYDGHPYARPRNGTPATLRTLSREHLVAVHERMMNAPRHIIVAGPIPPDVAREKLNRALGSLPNHTAYHRLDRAALRPRSGVLALKDDAVQTAFRVALPSTSFASDDYAAVQICTGVLGGYTLARLFTILREEKGYTYGAYAFGDVRPHGSTIGVVTSVGNEFTHDTMRVIAAEIERIGTQRINDEEFSNAQQHLLGSFARSNETPQQTAGLVWSMIHHQVPMSFYNTYVERLQRLTPDDVREAQRTYFTRDAWVVGLAGREDVIRPAIDGMVDTVEVWTPEGYA
jgi:predicted Zn-dependent peptidase